MKRAFNLICCYFLITVNSAPNNNVGKQPFTLDEFLNSTYSAISWNGTWLDDESFMYKKNGDYYLYNASTNKEKAFIAGSSLKSFNGSTLKISKDKKYSLIKYNVTQVYRHSTLASYAIGKISTGNTQLLKNELTMDPLFQYCEISPFNNNSLVAVQNNNIYYYQSIENLPKPIAITKDGSPSIYNGVPDWVYEEEVFQSDSALWLSPYAESLVYAKFDDTNVPEFSYYKYGKPGAMEDQYPKLVTVNYPKVEAPNPTFSLYCVDLKKPSQSKKIIFDFDKGKTSADFILYDVTWKDATNFYVTYTNRVQNIGKLLDCSVTTGNCKILETNKQTNGWLEIMPTHFLDNQERVYRANTDSDVHTLIVTKPNGITSLKIDNKMISKIYGHLKDTIFFEGSDISNHSQQHVYAIDSKTSTLSCVTCNFTIPEGRCTYARAEFSSNMSYMTRICLGPGPTYIDIFNVKKKTTTKIFETNRKLREALKNKSMPIVKDLTVDIPKSKFKAAVRLLLPPDFVESQKYPMLVNVYAGPNSKQISDEYSIGLQHYLVTNKKYIYALIDGRGSSKRGIDLMHSVYKNLGKYEIDDQITTTRKLRDTYKYIDANKICIWGWSYGGFATAWAIARDTSTFKCGVSVAPVTSFIYYDSIYTERYMDLPSVNAKGYNNTDLTRVAGSFRNKSFLLVHGNADDNVHYQQGMMLARSLELADVPFKQISYPDENHRLNGVLRHLYHSLDSFWDENFTGNTTKKENTSGASNGIHRERPTMFLLVIGVFKFLFN